MTDQNITIVGAGAVGICTALYLQRDGHQVTLVDQGVPGREGSSFGNAGLIQCASVVPLATPGLLSRIPGLLLRKSQPLVIRWRHLPTLFPYLARFLQSATAERAEAVSAALATIIPQAYEAYKPLIKEACAQHLVRQTGELHVYASEASRAGALYAHALRKAHGVEVRELSAAELADVEPALSRDLTSAVYLPAAYQTADPFIFLQALARRFGAAGGVVVQERVQDIEMGRDGPEALLTSAGRRPIKQLVISTGAFSKVWAAKLGSDVPLDSERGYHVTLTNPSVSLRCGVISGDYRIAMVQLQDQIRLTGFAELAAVGAAPDYKYARRLLPLAQLLLPGLNGAHASEWMGHRPSTPDGLPIIGRSPLHRSVYFAFGHNHSGLTLAAITGRLVADLVADRSPAICLAPFRVDRF